MSKEEKNENEQTLYPADSRVVYSGGMGYMGYIDRKKKFT